MSASLLYVPCELCAEFGASLLDKFCRLAYILSADLDRVLAALSCWGVGCGEKGSMLAFRAPPQVVQYFFFFRDLVLGLLQSHNLIDI